MVRSKVEPFNTAMLGSTRRRSRKPTDYCSRQRIYSQGDPADAVFYVVYGKVKLVITSDQGKEAVIALAGAGELFGEICLVSSVRLATAECMTATRVIRIEKADLMRALHTQPGLAESFAYRLVQRVGCIQADLAAHIFSSAEKRLARALLSLAKFDRKIPRDTYATRIDQQTLADMVGTTRPRVSFFLNKFSRLGFIDYGADLKIHQSLRNVSPPD